MAKGTGPSNAITSPQTPPTIKEQIEANIEQIKAINYRTGHELEQQFLIASSEFDDVGNLSKLLEDVQQELVGLSNQTNMQYFPESDG